MPFGTCAKNDISAARITDKSGKKDIAYCCKVEGLTSDFLNGAKVLDICPASEAICIDTRASLAYAQSVKQAEIVQKLIDKGVGIIDPKTVYISPDAEFEPDCTVYPNTVIRGRSHIAEGCIIGPSSTVENCKIGKYAGGDKFRYIRQRVCREHICRPVRRRAPGFCHRLRR